MPDDSQLLRRYVHEKADAAFAELVHRHVDLVYSAALRELNGDAHRAHDVTQVVFTTLARKAASLVDHPVLIGWLYTTTHFAAEKTIRTEQRRRAREREAHAMHELLSSDGEAIDWTRTRPVLDAAMRELGERDREAGLLRFFARRPFADIGAALSLSEDAARMRVERALDKLHGLLAKRGVKSTAAALATTLAAHAVTSAPAGIAGIVTTAALGQGGATSATLIAFMSTTKFAAAVSVVLVLAALGIAVRERAFAAETTADAATLRSEVVAQRAAVQRLAHQSETLDADVANLQSAMDRARAAAANALRATKTLAGSGGPGADSQDPVAAGTAFLTAHPEVRQALVDRSRARVDARFRTLYGQLNLTPEQIERFRSLLIEGEGLSMGNAESSMILLPGTDMARTEMDQGVHALLGDDGYRAYRDTLQLSGLQSTTTQLAAALAFSDTPLTPTQAQQLTQMLQANRKWDVFYAQAQSVLSAPQLEALRGMHVEEDFGRSMSEDVKRWMSEATDAARKAGK